MKVWVTKYALSNGIYEREAEQCSQPSMVKVKKSDWICGEYYHTEGREWHRTRDAAVVKANAMRQAKIKTLQKQLAKLQEPFK